MTRQPTKPPKRFKPLPSARREFVGCEMANLLYLVKTTEGVPKHIRERAALLQERWDTVSDFRLDNPITEYEMAEKLGFGEPSEARMAQAEADRQSRRSRGMP